MRCRDAEGLTRGTRGDQTEQVIAGGEEGLSLAALESTFQFPLDKFQLKAVDMFLQGSSVVVCAPTGAGFEPPLLSTCSVPARWHF